MSIVKAYPHNLTPEIIMTTSHVVVINVAQNLHELDNVLAAAGAEIVPCYDNIPELPEDDCLAKFEVRDLCDTDLNDQVEQNVSGMYHVLGFYKTADAIKAAFDRAGDADVYQSRAAYALEYLRNIHAELQWTDNIAKAAQWYDATTL